MQKVLIHLAGLSIMLCSAGVANADGWSAEGTPWQFQTNADRANKALITDLIERKKGGYYDAFKINNYYTTTIERQVNCNFSPQAKGNDSATSQGNDASAGNPRGSSGNSAGSTGNSNGNSGSLNHGGSVASNQSNSGQVGSSVTGSHSTTQFGPTNAQGGSTRQDAQTSQTNSGNQTVNVSGSTACEFAAGSAFN